jgi:hypothetical protein
MLLRLAKQICVHNVGLHKESAKSDKSAYQ